MSLKYGLNVKKAAPAPTRRPILDDEDDEDEVAPNGASEEAAVEEISTFGGGGKSTTSAAPPQQSRKSKTSSTAPLPPARKKLQPLEDRQDLSSASASASHIAAAASTDPSIFDYDSFHDAKSTVSAAKKEAERQDAIERKPKYIGNLLDAAARRKQDQLVAREKLLQKERENEGEEFADKEKFVTGAYKAHQEEARRLEEEEKVKKEQEEERRRRGGGGMQGFYRGMMDERERAHKEAMEAAEKVEKEGGAGGAEGAGEGRQKSDRELAEEARGMGVTVHLNEEGQITDKRELLTAGLNIGSGSNNSNSKNARGGADHLKSSNRQSAFTSKQNDVGGKQAQRERQTRMVEEQLEAQAKRAREEEEEERVAMEKKAKSAKTEGDVSDAKARFLARKAAREKEKEGAKG